jgi:AcrR family transcriptional regulator
MGEVVDEGVVAGTAPGRNRRGERTRRELIAAAWRVADGMSLQELLSGLTPSVVAREAGMTTGAVRHHFGDPADLVAAMVEDHLAERPATYVVDADEVRHHESSFDAEAIRAGILGYWQLRARPEERQRAHRSRLLASRAWQTTMPDGRHLDQVLVEGMARSHVELDAPSLDALLERLGRQWVPPFETSTVVRIVEAMCAGLLDQAELEPGSIDEQVFADALSAILLTFSHHAPAAAGIADFGVADLAAPSDDLRHAQEIAAASIGVFDRDPAELTLSQVALETGRQHSELTELFGTVRRMAAIAFVVAYPAVAESANRRLLTDPDRAVVDALCDIARTARDHPHVARALLAERRADPDPTAGPAIEIRMAVPIGLALSPALRMTGRVPSADLARVVGEMIEVVLEVASSNPRLAPADVAVEALQGLSEGEVSSPK